MKNLQWRNSNCKKEKWGFPCKQDSSWSRSRGWVGSPKSKQIDSFFWQEKLRLRTWRAGFSLPPVTALMTGSVAQTEHIPQGWRVGMGPAAVKHHACILQQERMSGTNSLCLVLRTDFSSSYFSNWQKNCYAAHIHLYCAYFKTEGPSVRYFRISVFF